MFKWKKQKDVSKTKAEELEQGREKPKKIYKVVLHFYIAHNHFSEETKNKLLNSIAGFISADKCELDEKMVQVIFRRRKFESREQAFIWGKKRASDIETMFGFSITLNTGRENEGIEVASDDIWDLQ